MDSSEPRAVYDCAKLDRFQQFESPNVYLHSAFLETEMTVLGWAVYFAGRDLDECKEIIKYASSVEDSDPYLPMREGFFRGKTAREVAEYYQRKDLAVLLEKMEKKFEGKKTAAASAKPNLSRRDSKGFVGVALPFRGSARASPSAKSSVVGGKTGADLDPSAFAKHQQAMLGYLEQVKIPSDERDEVCRTLMESRFYSLKKLAGAEREDLSQLGFNQPTVDLLLSQQHTIVGGEDTPPPVVEVASPVAATTVAPVMDAAAEEEKGEEDPDAAEFHERVRQMQADLEREEAEEAILKRALHGGEDQDSEDEAPSAAVANQDDSLFDASPSKPTPKSPDSPKAQTRTATALLPPLPASKRFHFYLSYSWGKHQAVKNRVDTLAKMLRHRGYLVWVDVEQFGDDVEEDCRNGVAHSCVFLACLTTGYVDNILANRSWNAVEMTAAKQSGAHMLGLQFDPKASLPALNTVDFTHHPTTDDDAITNLLAAVEEWI